LFCPGRTTREIITPQHLAIEKEHVSRLRGDCPPGGRLKTKQAARDAPAGAVLGSATVFIEPGSSSERDKLLSGARYSPSLLLFRMNGVAMMDGTKGQLHQD